MPDAGSPPSAAPAVSPKDTLLDRVPLNYIVEMKDAAQPRSAVAFPWVGAVPRGWEQRT